MAGKRVVGSRHSGCGRQESHHPGRGRGGWQAKTDDCQQEPICATGQIHVTSGTWTELIRLRGGLWRYCNRHFQECWVPGPILRSVVWSCSLYITTVSSIVNCWIEVIMHWSEGGVSSGEGGKHINVHFAFKNGFVTERVLVLCHDRFTLLSQKMQGHTLGLTIW